MTVGSISVHYGGMSGNNVKLHLSVTPVLVALYGLAEEPGADLRQGRLSADPSSNTFIVTHVPDLEFRIKHDRSAIIGNNQLSTRVNQQ